MFKNLEIFQMSHAMAVHAGQKQAVVSQNVANADTPGYKARTIAGFSETYATREGAASTSMQRATRDKHLHGSSVDQAAEPVVDDSSEASPNGNTVSLETEMLKSIDAKREHDRALAIYKSALGVLRTSLGR